jgi:hypothetical protein
MNIDRDVRLSGFASFVGKSSMEVTLKVDQVNIEINENDYLCEI